LELDKLTISPDTTVKDALRQIDQGAEKILFVVDEAGLLLGVLTDGDIRRYILGEGQLTGGIEACINRSPIYLKEGYQRDTAKKLMLEHKIAVMPVVDESRVLVDYISWEKLFGEALIAERKKAGVPVVIMAGGKGTRLDPFTKILPKPLIPIGDKPIVELIMDKFHAYSVTDFYLTVNYKAEMIKSYFDNTDTGYNIHYIWEKEFLGTAGSLRLLPEGFTKTFIVSNCDIIIEADYADLVDFHKKNGYYLTVVGSVQHYRIPYGIMEFEEGGFLKTITEKPEYDLVINTGLYVLEDKALRYIPEKGTFDMTDLIGRLLAEGRSVGVYPISEKSYTDIGQWEEYSENFKRFMLE
jgi:dTDP-glucose pyrophosphorylase